MTERQAPHVSDKEADLWTHWLLTGGEGEVDTKAPRYQRVRQEMAEALRLAKRKLAVLTQQ